MNTDAASNEPREGHSVDGVTIDELRDGLSTIGWRGAAEWFFSTVGCRAALGMSAADMASLDDIAEAGKADPPDPLVVRMLGCHLKQEADIEHTRSRLATIESVLCAPAKGPQGRSAGMATELDEVRRALEEATALLGAEREAKDALEARHTGELKEITARRAAADRLAGSFAAALRAATSPQRAASSRDVSSPQGHLQRELAGTQKRQQLLWDLSRVHEELAAAEDEATKAGFVQVFDALQRGKLAIEVRDALIATFGSLRGAFSRMRVVGTGPVLDTEEVRKGLSIANLNCVAPALLEALKNGKDGINEGDFLSLEKLVAEKRELEFSEDLMVDMHSQMLESDDRVGSLRRRVARLNRALASHDGTGAGEHEIFVATCDGAIAAAVASIIVCQCELTACLYSPSEVLRSLDFGSSSNVLSIPAGDPCWSLYKHALPWGQQVGVSTRTHTSPTSKDRRRQGSRFGSFRAPGRQSINPQTTGVHLDLPAVRGGKRPSSAGQRNRSLRQDLPPSSKLLSASAGAIASLR
eukprot:Hpha_TRINITY_DN15699_c0_g1::TRINITY_DN15699_c0_g1_i3::g.98433::m.98433